MTALFVGEKRVEPVDERLFKIKQSAQHYASTSSGLAGLSRGGSAIAPARTANSTTWSVANATPTEQPNREPSKPKEPAPPHEIVRRMKKMLDVLHPRIEAWWKGRGTEYPDWCSEIFLPHRAWYEIMATSPMVLKIEDEKHPPEYCCYRLIHSLSAICSWRYTQGIYRFAPNFLKELCSSPLVGTVPVKLFFRLPQWSIYVETPGFTYKNEALHGFWAQILERSDGDYELNIVLNLAKDLITGCFLLREGLTLREILAVSAQDVGKDGAECDFLAEFFTPLFSLLLYLCSQEPDIVSARGKGERPENARLQNTKRGWRLFPAAGPHFWKIGDTFEHAVSTYRHALNRAKRSGVSERVIRTHFRCAHWHTYLTGPRPKPGQKSNQKPVLHWLAPMIVHGSRTTPEPNEQPT